MAKVPRKYTNNDLVAAGIKRTFLVSADALSGTDTDVSTWVFDLPFFGRLTDVQFSAAVTGTGGTSTTLDVLDDGTSVLSTNGVILPAAANESVIRVGSAIANTTAPVIDATKQDIAENSKVKITLTTAGTMSPVVSDVVVMLEFEELQATDFSSQVARS